MKRGYKRLLIFEILIFIILILNSFVWNILSSYTSSILLIIILVAFKLLFGFEKDKHRYLKDLLMEVFIFVFIFLMLFYLLGVIISYKVSYIQCSSNIKHNKYNYCSNK